MGEEKVLCACGCGTEIDRLDAEGRPRRFVNGHSMRGRRLSVERRSQISASLRIRPVSAETRARMSATRRGRHPSDETRAKISASHQGMTHSPETRRCLSEATKKAHQLNPDLLKRGADNPGWKGGRYVDKSGYVLVRVPDHPRQQKGYVYEHVLVYEAAHGPVARGSVIHHKNGDRQDNCLENLQAMTRASHRRTHAAIAKVKGGMP